MKNELVIWVMLIMCIIHSSRAVTFDLGSTNSSHYTNSLETLRSSTKGTKEHFGIPMLPKPTNPLSYITVVLTLGRNSIKLGLERRNLYVVGYSDVFNKKERAYLVNDAPPNAKGSAFPKVTDITTLKFGGSYKELENKAGKRQKLGLGIKMLNSRFERVYGKDKKQLKENDQAQFLLVAVQMVSEATRFIYIRDQVILNFSSVNFKPNDKVISLQTEWGKISTAIATAKVGGNFTTDPVVIKSPTGANVTLRNVNDIKPDMGILNYVA